MRQSARAFWTVPPGGGEIREAALPDVSPGTVVVRTRYSAVSRGTRRL